MAQGSPFISAHLRALALATEVGERVRDAVRFASSSDDVVATAVEGHFGTGITIFEAELEKARDLKRFLARLEEHGVRAALAGQAEARVDEGRVFHFRLDKQQAYLGRLVIASGKDVIDVALKVGVYPASREAAVRAVGQWLEGPDSPGTESY